MCGWVFIGRLVRYASLQMCILKISELNGVIGYCTVRENNGERDGKDLNC